MRKFAIPTPTEADYKADNQISQVQELLFDLQKEAPSTLDLPLCEVVERMWYRAMRLDANGGTQTQTRQIAELMEALANLRDAVRGNDGKWLLKCNRQAGKVLNAISLEQCGMSYASSVKSFPQKNE